MSDEEGLKLRRLVWEPIAAHLPPGTTSLFLAPDGEPGGPSLRRPPRSQGSHSPAGPVRHRARTARPVPPGASGAEAPPAREVGPFLALGGVQYDPPQPALPGSLGALRLAERVAATRPTITLQQRQATPGALCGRCPGPLTPSSRRTPSTGGTCGSRKKSDGSPSFATGLRPGGCRRWRGLAPTARSPLIYTGLILAREGQTPGKASNSQVA